MWNSPEILRHLDFVRHGATTVAHLPFGEDTIVEACGRIEQAGMPAVYLLPATAREYTAIRKTEELVAKLACQVGNPRISPTPPLWPLLALLLLGWRHTISPAHVIALSSAFGIEDEAHRGLLIVAYLFPELQGWVAAVPSRIPRWERAIAVPLAARKLTRFEKTE